MKKLKPNTFLQTHRSHKENELSQKIEKLFKECPIPNDQILSNLGLFLHRRDLSRILFMDHIYKLIVDIPGIVIDFGTRWGSNMAIFSALRGIYDPIHMQRKIVGFDTFKGFPEISKKDGNTEVMGIGRVSVPENYEKYLQQVLDFHDQVEPLGHIKQYEICKGDVNKKLPEFLKKHPETIIGLAFFDLNLYSPTKNCLKAIKPRLIKGSVLAFDELNDQTCPGETLALLEIFGLNNIRPKRLPGVSRTSYFVFE